MSIICYYNYHRSDKILKKNKINFCSIIVIFCISFIVFYTLLQVFLSYKLNIELSPTLTTCVYGFFGTELTATTFIKIFNQKFKKENDNGEFSE